MTRVEYRPSASVTLSLPAALVLGGLFFLPWVEVRCNGGGHLPAGKFGAASGWQIARGEFSVEPQYADQVWRFSGQDLPRKQPWVYAGLGVPAALGLVAFLCLGGSAGPGATGKVLVLGGLGGLAVTVVVGLMNYGIRDVKATLDEASPQVEGRRVPIWERGSINRQAEAARQARQEKLDQVDRMAAVRPTPYLWASAALYGLVALCGMTAKTVPVAAARRACTSGAASPQGPASGPAGLAANRPGSGYHVYRANRPYQPNEPGATGKGAPGSQMPPSGRWHG